MYTELFGVFGGRDAFEQLRASSRFDAVVEGDAVTVGVRDEALGELNRTSTYRGRDGYCVVFGELYPPQWVEATPARWVYHHYQTAGERALADLNGSYVIVIEYDGVVVVVTDQLRSRECFYTRADPTVFGTDSVNVARTIQDRTIDYESLLEYLYLSVVLGEDTLYEELHRIPFDGVLERGGVRTLDRFVYQPDSFDYVAALADGLERAIERRTRTATSTGLLLSAGYDSRALLTSGEIDVCYTVGSADSQEVATAERIAGQYDSAHVALPPDDRYLNTDPEMCRYTNGIKEALHIHHAGYESEMQTRTMLHGWAFDSLLREHFVPQRTVEVMGRVLPLRSLEPESDFDPVEFATRKFGYLSEAANLHDKFRARGYVDFGPRSFVDATVRREFENCRRSDESVHNAANRFGVQNLPSAPFRHHLVDTFRESFVAADADLITWHLRTPPEHRTTETYLRALRRLDDGLLRIRPPDRPHDTFLANQAQKFIRRKLPFVESFGTPWPDRRAVYERNRLDEVLFHDQPWLHSLSPRFKLRVHDALCWIDAVEQRAAVTPGALLGEESFDISE